MQLRVGKLIELISMLKMCSMYGIAMIVPFETQGKAQLFWDMKIVAAVSLNTNYDVSAFTILEQINNSKVSTQP